MTRRGRRPFNPHYWVQVRVGLHCRLGDHQVAAGEWVRYRKTDPLLMASCETCLAKQGVERPHRKVVLRRDDGVDARARRAGGDE